MSLKSIDKVPYILLATFVLVGASSYLHQTEDNFISKSIKIASANTAIKTSAQKIDQSSVYLKPNNETPMQKPITRNPFKSPSSSPTFIPQKIENGQIVSDNSDVFPVLHGTIIGSAKSAVIASMGYESNYYAIGDRIGPYKLVAIEKDSIKVRKDGKDTTLKLGQKTLRIPKISQTNLAPQELNTIKDSSMKLPNQLIETLPSQLNNIANNTPDSIVTKPQNVTNKRIQDEIYQTLNNGRTSK